VNEKKSTSSSSLILPVSVAVGSAPKTLVGAGKVKALNGIGVALRRVLLGSASATTAA
jgi:hypothetical protein